jgi:hypothetical protein
MNTGGGESGSECNNAQMGPDDEGGKNLQVV